MFYLKHKNDIVLEFDPKTLYVKLINGKWLPVGLHNLPVDYSLIRAFCNNRVLLFNRAFCKEILITCGLDDQDPINICLVSRALSFTDNYWIDNSNDSKRWEDINLRDNVYHDTLSVTAITGKPGAGTITLGDDFYTGELTTKGTRPKCFVREDGKIWLYKHLTQRELSAELLSHVIASILGLKAVKYHLAEYAGVPCSKCEIMKDTDYELLHCRDILKFFDCDMAINSKAFVYFMDIDSINFTLLMLFDYLTLNTDRNRDNYGVLVKDGITLGLYPAFDHDSCFKGKGTNAHYFCTKTSFDKTLEFLKTAGLLQSVCASILTAYEYFKSETFKEFFCKFLDEKDYLGLLERSEKLYQSL